MSQARPDPQRVASLRLLREQAEEAARALAEALGAIRGEQRREQEKLANLHGFIAHYRKELEVIQRSGIMWARVREVRAFIARLEGAQVAQEAEIQRMARLLEEKTNEWAVARQREKAFEILISQQESAAMAYARKQELDALQEWNLNVAATFATSGSGRQERS